MHGNISALLVLEDGFCNRKGDLKVVRRFSELIVGYVGVRTTFSHQDQGFLGPYYTLCSALT